MGIDIAYQDGEGASPGYLVDDLNEGYGGKYVYIKPIFTSDKSAAASGFDVVIKDVADNNPLAKDVSKGAGDLGAGKFRYIIPRYIDDSPKVKYINIVETLSKEDSCTQNINKGRGGRTLYLCWHSQ